MRRRGRDISHPNSQCVFAWMDLDWIPERELSRVQVDYLVRQVQHHLRERSARQDAEMEIMSIKGGGDGMGWRTPAKIYLQILRSAKFLEEDCYTCVELSNHRP